MEFKWIRDGVKGILLTAREIIQSKMTPQQSKVEMIFRDRQQQVEHLLEIMSGIKSFKEGTAVKTGFQHQAKCSKINHRQIS